jgi:hypothetical protein
MRDSPAPPRNPDRDDAFWKAHNGVGLVWSNPKASDDVMISRALLNPNFHLLLDIAERFGLPRLAGQWEKLKESVEAVRKIGGDGDTTYQELLRATPIVERCLQTMQAAVK